MKRQAWAAAIMFIAAAAASGADFGLILGTEGEYAGGPGPGGFLIRAAASPWFSAEPGGALSLHVSGKITYEHEAGGDAPHAWFFEPGRAELSLRPAPGLRLNLGRQHFQDPAGIIASGLFDGLSGSLGLGACRLSLGAYYTGLLYKETAKVLMTPGDLERYREPPGAGGLKGYSASRRVLAALTGEFPDLTSRAGLAVQALSQFDLNGDAAGLDTHYLELRAALEPFDPLHINLGCAGELGRGAGETWGAMAAFLGAGWELPGALADLLSAGLSWAGGRVNSGIRAFAPVSGKAAGQIFDGGAGALAKAALSYRARPAAGFSFDAGAAYFIRADLETLADPDIDAGSGSRLLGGEAYGSLAWGPDPAFRFNAGGGAFFPGGAYREGAPVKWKASFGAAVSL